MLNAQELHCEATNDPYDVSHLCCAPSVDLPTTACMLTSAPLLRVDRAVLHLHKRTQDNKMLSTKVSCIRLRRWAIS